MRIREVRIRGSEEVTEQAAELRGSLQRHTVRGLGKDGNKKC